MRPATVTVIILGGTISVLGLAPSFKAEALQIGEELVAMARVLGKVILECWADHKESSKNNLEGISKDGSHVARPTKVTP